MRSFPRILTVVAAAVALVAPAVVLTLGLPSATLASAKSSFVVRDAFAYEFAWTCASTAPFTCERVNPDVIVRIEGRDLPKRREPITVDWRVEEITAVRGVNFTGPTSGTATIPDNNFATTIRIPVLDTGAAGPDTTFRVRLTGSSLPRADLSDTGLGTIRNGGRIPRDCEPSRSDADSMSLTCTDRPATEQWRLDLRCGIFAPPLIVRGNPVTGNGTSAASCPRSSYYPLAGWSRTVIT